MKYTRIGHRVHTVFCFKMKINSLFNDWSNHYLLHHYFKHLSNCVIWNNSLSINSIKFPSNRTSIFTLFWNNRELLIWWKLTCYFATLRTVLKQKFCYNTIKNHATATQAEKTENTSLCHSRLHFISSSKIKLDETGFLFEKPQNFLDDPICR